MPEILTIVFWIIFILFFIVPVFRRQMLGARRIKGIRFIERMRNSRVITLIHRQEALGFLGIPFYRYIDIEDSERILRAVRFTPDDMPIDFIIHTPGGLVLASEQIAHALRRHKAKVTVFVPHYAMSGGTLLALAADEIVMGDNAVLGSVDPQIGMQYPASSILWLTQVKDRDKLEDSTLIFADMARKAVSQIQGLIYEILKDRLGEEKAKELSQILTEGRWTHDYPLTVEKLAVLGIPVKVELPKEIYALMELYPQPVPRRPSVEFVPVPYERRERGSKPS
ncbi:MAG: ATP-dependent Clp protease proteolytic subunit [Actinomycetota bacterium]